MINAIAARMDFENGVRIFQEAFRDTLVNGQPVDVINQFKLTQSDLQLEQPLIANTNNYTFPLLVGQQGQGNTLFNTEIRLNQQDTFLPQYIGFIIIPATSNTDTTWRPLTWANPAVLTNATQMNAIYNGQMNIAMNNTNYITNWQMSRHMYIPQTQQTSGLGVGSPADQFEGDSTLYPFQPQVILTGTSNVQVTISLPVAPNAVDPFSRIGIKMRGIIAYNSTVVN